MYRTNQTLVILLPHSTFINLTMNTPTTELRGTSLVRTLSTRFAIYSLSQLRMTGLRRLTTARTPTRRLTQLSSSNMETGPYNLFLNSNLMRLITLDVRN